MTLIWKLDVLWEAAHRDLPPLVQKLDAYLTAHPPQTSLDAPPEGFSS